MTESSRQTTSSKVAYDIALHTVAAQQLWSGRRAERGQTFIPGIVDFHHTVTALEADAGAANRLGGIDAGIQEVRAALREWRLQSDSFICAALPENTAPAIRNSEPKRESLRFGDARSRQLAMLIASFDEACQAALEAASVARDVDAPRAPSAQGEIRRHAKQIRQLLYLPR